MNLIHREYYERERSRNLKLMSITRYSTPPISFSLSIEMLIYNLDELYMLFYALDLLQGMQEIPGSFYGRISSFRKPHRHVTIIF